MTRSCQNLAIGAGLILVAVLALAIACSSSGAGDSGPTGPSSFDFGSNDPFRVSAFGDSITFGVLEEQKRVTVGLATSNNYPNILQGQLRALNPAWRVVNRGVPGERTSEGVRRLPSILKADQPGFILIMEGTNDASAELRPDLIVGNLEAMVLAAKGNKTIPVLGTIPPNFRNDPQAQDIISKANPQIRTIAQVQQIVLAEIFDGMNDRSLFGQSPDRDPLHPNEEGYRVMANIWFEAMKRAMPGSIASSSSSSSSAASSSSASSSSSSEVGQSRAPRPPPPVAAETPVPGRQRTRRR
jgi:lysophospholipase L1-like esterase